MIKGGGGGEGREVLVGLCWCEGGGAAPSPHTLHLLTSLHHHRLAWLPAPHASPGLAPHDPAAAAVVDGAALLITPFRQATVPPPMAALKATFPETINGLCFCQAAATASAEGDVDDSGFLEAAEEVGGAGGVWAGAVCVQHGPNTLTILAPAPAQDTPAPAAVPAHLRCVVEATGACGAAVQPWGVLGQVVVEWPGGVTPRPGQASDLYHWCWPTRDTLAAVFTAGAACCLALLDLQLEGGRAVARQVVVLEDSVLALAATPTLAALQLATGGLVQVELGSGAVEPLLVDGAEVVLPGACQRLALCTLEGGAAPLPLALTQRGRLYLGHQQLLADCTSVLVHGRHLLATTATHTLLAAPLAAPALARLGQAESGVRRMERGGRLVVAVAGDSRVVLQLPRGNLEVVSPRPLVVAALTRLLAAHQYAAALALARRHRLDTNLLYDHDPAHFLAAARPFVVDVADPQRLDLFLAALTEADTTAAAYAFHYPGRATTAGPSEGKVAAVCEALRAAMAAVDEERYRLPILTSLAQAGRMEEALARLGERRRLEAAGQAEAGGAEEGLRHLLYLADTEVLYRLALGTYDLALALMVAQRSQRDPKEFLPQLHALEALPEPLRRCRIDVMLGRHRRAIRGLAAMADHRQELLGLVEGRGLHALALQELPQGSEVKAAVCESYARVLAAKGRPGEAAIMFERAGEYAAALETYRQAGEWRMALVAAARLGLAKERLVELCHGLAAELKGRGQHAQAATLYEEHLGAEEEAVACLAAAGAWLDGLRLAHKHSRQDLIETNILPALQQAADAMKADITELTETLASQAGRLAVVRQAGAQQAAAGPAPGLDDAPLDCDLYSDTSTMSGLDHRPGLPRRPASTASASSRSQRSSRSRRKLARKKYSTKPGSPHEDLGLVAALHQAYTALAAHAQTLAALTVALVTLGRDAPAAALQEQFTALLKLAEGKKAEIWPPLTPADQSEVEFGPNMTTEAAVQQMHGGQAAAAGAAAASYLAQRMAQLDPHLRHAPPPPPDSWRLGLLHPHYTGE